MALPKITSLLSEGGIIGVIPVPPGTAYLHVARCSALSGGSVEYDLGKQPVPYTGGRLSTPIRGSVSLPYVGVQALDVNKRAVSEWAMRVKTSQPAPPPPVPSSLIVGVDTSGWSGSLHDELTRGGILNRRINNPALIGEIEGKKGRVVSVCLHNAGWGSSQGPLLYDAAAYGAELGRLAKEHPNALSWEVLNEPEGAQNPTAADKIARYVAMLKASREALTAVGSKAKLIASWAPEYGFGQAWSKAGGLQYVDGVVVHAYGGSSGQHGGLTGARDLIAQAWREAKKPVYVTEIGWPTALGRPSTGDSQQWSEAQQEEAIKNFAAWCREPAQSYVAMFIYFNAVDYGTNNWYGTEREDRSHKPSFAALAAAAA